MTYSYPLSYLILSFFSLSYLLRSYDQDGETRFIPDGYLELWAPGNTNKKYPKNNIEL